ncbi:MAG: beta-galactosidase [Candidatus Sumerlaeota bacterium]|nr:beta-galactosidase [Candidatus Sumerlaeota bacterium]
MTAKQNTLLLLIVLGSVMNVPSATVDLQENILPLAGTWQFRLDPQNVGVEKKWFSEKLDDSVTLPGTTDTNQKGVLKDEQAVDRLSRVWYWKGPAWYQREVAIPDAWKGKRTILLLERTKNTRVWVDDRDCGADDTLSAPQVFDLTAAITPGRHTITVLVDNAKLPPVGPSHAVDERTQSNWNGIIGKMELRATDPVWLEETQVYPDVDNRQATIRAVVGNITGKAASGRIVISGKSWNAPASVAFPAQSADISAPKEKNEITLTYKLGQEAPLWDEFHPALIRLAVSLEANAGEKHYGDERIVNFGMRKFVRDSKRLTINGRTVFLRGRTDSCNYPLTGYAPMDKAEWIRLLKIEQSYGLNHCRFHSWFPPEAALEAADELGMYLAPELPNKSSRFGSLKEREAGERYNVDFLEVDSATSHTPLAKYLLREGTLIFNAYGNHPSFAMFTLGNELGRSPAMYQMVAYFKEIDPRRLYAQGSNNMHWAPSFAEGDDFWVTCKTGKDLPVRGAFFPADYPYGHIDYRPPSTMVDYSASIKDVPAPIISHEMGEFEVTPDFSEIPKYTGVLKARNLEIFRQRLKDANMLDLSHDFMRASGALAAICQREDIEAALRTPGFSGFQLLDLQDFPGQGTALVGMLNVFMESKGLIAPDKWRQFCCETVPLLLFEKFTWTTDETFTGEIKIAHYGAADIPNARVSWTVCGSEGSAVASGALGPMTIKQGEVFPVGWMRVPLDRFKAPKKLTVTAAIEGTSYRNGYDIWVYPPKADTSAPGNVLITGRLDAAAQKHLNGGGKVLLFPRHDELKHCVKGAFQTDFWCWPMFAKGAIARGIEPAPGTQGFLCDPKHPTLADFPTEFHSNWQWWRLVKNARPIILDETPADYRPIIHVIDNFARNHKLGLLFESRVSQGKLLVCASDLPALQAHPEARQLMHSLLRYIDSPAFAPQAELDAGLLKKLLPGKVVSH